MPLIDIERLRLVLPALDEVRFVALCNTLLSELAAQHEIPRPCFRLNLNTKEPDGGIDAACVDVDNRIPRLIPRRETVFQFKSGRNPRTAQQLVNEDVLQKPRVLEALGRGAALVFLAGWDRGDGFEEDVRTRLRASGLVIDDDQFFFSGKESLVQWLPAVPSLVIQYVGVDLEAHLFDIERWSGFRTMSNEYVTDDGLTRRVSELRTRIEQPGSTVRVLGSAGDGKTRMVLEAIRNSDLSVSVVYAEQAEAVTGDVIRHLTQTTGVRCTLVVDEADDAAAERLENLLHGRPTSVRLILIGVDAAARPFGNVLQVEGLSNDLLVDIVKRNAPGVPEDVARGIAEDCERSPKLAVFIADRIRNNPQLVRATLLRDRGLRNALDLYLQLEPTDIPWRAIAGASLVMRLGWSGELEGESTHLYGILGLDPVQARREVQRLHERHGIAPIAGRYRYVSPAILADHFAASEVNAWTRDRIVEFLEALTPEMADSFARRARRLSASLDNAAAVEEVLLGEGGPFRSLDDIERTTMSSMLPRLAAAFPRGALRALDRLISTATYEQLAGATHSRRDLYWALEELLWPAETFETAAGLLLRLAIAENETWANNASGTWVETFQMVLGRTAAGWESRLRAIRQASRNSEPKARLLAAQAVSAALNTGQVTRGGNPPHDVPGMPTQEWRPATYDEWADAAIAYLGELELLIRDPQRDVRIAAAKALGVGATNLFHLLDSVVTRWQEITLQIADADYDLRTEVLKPIEWAIDRWSERAAELQASHGSGATDPSTETSASEIEAIAGRIRVLRNVERTLARGGEFATDFRRAITARPHRRRNVSWEQAEESFRNELSRLADRVLLDPSLLTEADWEWLTQQENWRGAGQWAEIIGALDKHRTMEAKFERESLKSKQGIAWLSLYDLGFALKVSGPDFLNGRIDQLMRRGLFDHAFDLIFRAGYSSERHQQLVQLLRMGQAPRGSLSQLAFGSWSAISAAEGAELLAAAVASGEGAGAVVEYLNSHLLHSPEDSGTLRSDALAALNATASETSARHDIYSWGELAKRYTATDASEILRLALERVSAFESSHDQGLIEIIRQAWDAGNRREMFDRIITPWLDGDYLRGFWVRSVLEQIPIEDLGEDFLLAWVRENPKTRARTLAELIGPPDTPMTRLQGELLADYSDQGVGGAFMSKLMSGVFWGSHAEWSRGKLERVRAWTADSRAAVRLWANTLVAGLEEDVRRSEASEAEDRFR